MPAPAGGHTVNMRTLAVVASCFLLTSIGWLTWIYHLMDVVPVESVDLATQVAGYLSQAVGLGVYAAVLFARPTMDMRPPSLAAVALYMAFLVPAATTASMAEALALGYLCNLACGFIAGFYLHCLAWLVPEKRRGTIFGIGYAIATVAAWPISLLDGGTLLHSANALVVCGVLALLAFYCVGTAFRGADDNDPAAPPSPPLSKRLASPLFTRKLIVIAGITVLALCLVKNMGNGFPAADMGGNVNLELSRLFYAVGLVIAGIACDRNRLYGMVCCMAALALPFITLSLANVSASAMVTWSLGYFFFGFFSVFRVVLFSDIAASTKKMWLAGWGLLIGRIGDAFGTAICLLLVQQLPALVIITALLFSASVFLCFWLYHQLYAASQPAQQSERQRFEAFAAHHDLSAREREVLRLVLDGKTNSEIAGELFVSESTVKFHVRNLLKKTGCTNRLELSAKYADPESEQANG